MPLITPEQVKAAYAKTGLIPIRGSFTRCRDDGRQCGCGLTALVLERLGTAAFDEIAGQGMVRNILNLDFAYAAGFEDGFDEIDDSIPDLSLGTEYVQGYEEGRAVADLVFS